MRRAQHKIKNTKRKLQAAPRKPHVKATEPIREEKQEVPPEDFCQQEPISEGKSCSTLDEANDADDNASEDMAQPQEPQSQQPIISSNDEKDNVEQKDEKPADIKPIDGWLTNQSFEELSVNEHLKKAIREHGFKAMTEIQSKSIPPLLAGKDVLAQAKTGSGKTLAFLVPVIELLYRAEFKARNGTGAIILAPTRELAIQIYAVAKDLMQHLNQTHTIVMGGSNKAYESQKLQRGANLVVATPGRLLDHLMHTSFNLQNMIALVMDEADRILEVGFEEEMRAILRLLPKKRQTMLFSATQTTKVSDLARLSLQGDPVCVGVTSKDEETTSLATVEKLEQGYIVVPADQKFILLFSFLKRNRDKKIIVFFSTCNSVKYHAELLTYIGIPVLDLHGKLKQNKRTNTFFNFCNAKEGILLCTDVAARGLDIPEVDWIIQIDPPDNPKDYVHRVGRTARAGRKGRALIFLLPSEKGFLRYLKQAGVPLNELGCPEKHLANIQTKLEDILQTNYYLYRTATDAFQSYIKAYSAHQLKEIFKFKDLDVKGVTKAFGLKVTPYVDLRSLEVGASHRFEKKRKDLPNSTGSNPNKKRKMDEQHSK